MEFLVMLSVGVLTVAVAIYILEPVVRPRRRKQGTYRGESMGDLEAAKDMVLKDIRELELDYATGKLNDEDYRSDLAAQKVRASDILEQIDRSEGGEARPPTAVVDDVDIEALIEQRVADVREKSPNQSDQIDCQECGVSNSSGAQFCMDCGTTLT